jgi:hypothetical protein
MRVPSGAPPQDLKQSKGTSIWPATWVPDSQSFIARLIREPEAESELWQVPVDGSAPRKLPLKLEAHVYKFTLNPDGRHVAYVFHEPGALLPHQVWKFENFLPTNSRRNIQGAKSSHTKSVRSLYSGLHLPANFH